MAPFRFGIVGCGGIAQRHGHAAAGSPDVDIVACCDVRLDVAEAWRDQFGCERAYGDHLTMVREHELDAILLATWPSQHHEQILGSLDAGARRILCEKSLALTAAEALDVLGAATAADALVVEGFMYRHHPANRTIEELVAAGRVGTVDHVHASFNLYDPEDVAPDDPNRDWRQRKEYGGGVPHDLASYCIDACNNLARSLPTRALALAKTSGRYGTVDRLYGLIDYDNGAVGIVESSRRSEFDHELEVAGALGRIRLPVAWRIQEPTEVVLSRSTGWGEFETTGFPIPLVDAFRLQLEHFAAVARGAATAVPALADSVVTALTLDALLTSGAEGVAVPVEIPTQLATP